MVALKKRNRLHMQIAKPRLACILTAAAVVAAAIAPPPRHSTAVATAVAPSSAKTRPKKTMECKIVDYAKRRINVCLLMRQRMNFLSREIKACNKLKPVSTVRVR